MPEGLITLGVSAVQIFASIFANLLFESARGKAFDKVKGQMVYAERFRRVVQTDINEVKEKINSMAQSRIYAAFDYVKRGLIILQGVAPQRTLSQLEKQGCEASVQKLAIVDYGNYANYEKFKIEVSSLIKDAERFFVQADVWATEAFSDKVNVPVPMRLECVRVQLFCAMLLHWQKPDQWVGLWKNIFVNTIADRGVVQGILAHNPWTSKQQKLAIKSTLVSVINEAVCSLWKIAHNDIGTADSASQLLNFIRAPKNVLQEKHHESWRSAIGLPMNSFTPWNGRLVVVIPHCYRICPISNNILCVIDKEFKIKFIDAVTLCAHELTEDPFKLPSPLFGKEFACVAYDPVDDLILATQFRPNELKLFSFDSKVRGLSLKETLPLPEPGYFVACTPSTGRWIFRSASGNVHLKDRGPNTPWLLVARGVSKVFDVLDEPELNIANFTSSRSDLSGSDTNMKSYYLSFGVRLLADFKITSFYRNPGAVESQENFIVKQSQSIDLKTILGPDLHGENVDAPNHCPLPQNLPLFDRKSPQLLIVAQKLHNGRLKLSQVSVAGGETMKLESSVLLPFYVEQSIEEIVVSDQNAVYLATARGIQLAECTCGGSDSAFSRTFRRLSTRLGIRSTDL